MPESVHVVSFCYTAAVTINVKLPYNTGTFKHSIVARKSVIDLQVPTRSDRNQVVQPQRMVGSWKFRILKLERPVVLFLAANNSASQPAWQFSRPAPSIFAYAKRRLTHEAAHLIKCASAYMYPIVKVLTFGHFRILNLYNVLPPGFYHMTINDTNWCRIRNPTQSRP